MAGSMWGGRRWGVDGTQVGEARQSSAGGREWGEGFCTQLPAASAPGGTPDTSSRPWAGWVRCLLSDLTWAPPFLPWGHPPPLTGL